MIRILIAFLGVIAVIWLMKYINRQPAKQRKMLWFQVIIGAVIIAIVFAALTGRLHWLGALTAVALPFLKHMLTAGLRLLPLLRFWQQHRSSSQSSVSSGNVSTVNTDFLSMQLDHDSGEMEGTVIEGPSKGRTLNQMQEEELKQLFCFCQENCEQSTQLLLAYLQHRFGEQWYDKQGFAEQDTGSRQDCTENNGLMSENEARQILGIEDSASEEEIIHAHRKLMQKLHPDRGGSDYLAAKINQAKDLLLQTKNSL